MARFKIDENLSIDVAAVLNSTGHDALTVPDQQLSGQADATIARVCRGEGRTLVTLDVDFADIRAYPPADYPGIIVLRLTRLDKHRVISAVSRMLPLLEQEPLVGKLWIVSETAVRIRS